MKFLSRIGRTALVMVWAFTTALHCAAAQAPSNVESLIRGNQWKEVSRAMFLEAWEADGSVLLPVEQAKAGFLDDALSLIDKMHLNTQPDILIRVADAPSIPSKRSFELAQQSLDLARTKSWESSNYLRSGTLAKIALFYSRNGVESDARTVFEEALQAAEKGVTEKGSGGYGRISQAMVDDPKKSKDWMVKLVAQRIHQQGRTLNSSFTLDLVELAKRFYREESTFESAFTYIDLAEVAAQLSQKSLAIELIQSGISAAKYIKRDSVQESAFEKLVNVARKVGYTTGLPDRSPYNQAIEEVRAGNPKKALAIASSLSENLYVDHGKAAYMLMFDDAMMRGDLNTALYLAEHPVRLAQWTQADVWRQIAELQATRGSKQDAAASYLRASKAISDSNEAVRYFEAVKGMLSIGESMRQHGFEAEGRKTSLDAQELIRFISGRRIDDKIRASILTAETLWRYDMHSEAKQLILRAYSDLHENIESKTEKGYLLSQLGKTTSTFIVQTSGKKNEGNDRKKTK